MPRRKSKSKSKHKSKKQSNTEAPVLSRKEQDAMKVDTETAHKEASHFHHQIDKANDELFEMEGQRGKAMMKHQQAKRELDQAKAFVDEQRRQFLEKSREFRASCKRIRFRSSVLGLEYAPLKAFATVVAGHKKNFVSPCDFVESNQTRVLLPATEDGQEADPGSDPTKWKPDARDEDMKKAIESYTKASERHGKAKQTLESETK